MVHAIMFDTFKYAKGLKKAGFTEIQIETQVEFVKEQTDSINNFIDKSIATKQDIELTRKDIKTLELRIEQIRVDLKSDLKVLGAIILLGVTVLGLLIKVH